MGLGSIVRSAAVAQPERSSSPPPRRRVPVAYAADPDPGVNEVLAFLGDGGGRPNPGRPGRRRWPRRPRLPPPGGPPSGGPLQPARRPVRSTSSPPGAAARAAGSVGSGLGRCQGRVSPPAGAGSCSARRRRSASRCGAASSKVACGAVTTTRVAAAASAVPSGKTVARASTQPPSAGCQRPLLAIFRVAVDHEHDRERAASCRPRGCR